jgi:hypothetical protein
VEFHVFRAWEFHVLEYWAVRRRRQVRTESSTSCAVMEFVPCLACRLSYIQSEALEQIDRLAHRKTVPKASRKQYAGVTQASKVCASNS